ncbi:RNA polymerase sigma-70 factor [Pedobacter africanus]|uniref:RNA polymerase sigma-70 factor (ECF subfamily) n=1 Tax=Pedobacter africanus TaxID=151894 RepID=A0ACC6L5D3_9SPHI|nr:RNA polymerase sigma-70 factor [Pedobacter africanus]MDR6786592.1 RNA polymerase sigma-70 factor (ECF subfamily) [Pedobacter africanus]
MSKPDLNELWDKMCSEDDVKSFEAIYYALFPKLIRFCQYYVTQQEIAEEIVSDIFVKVWQNRKHNGQVQKPDTYLFIAVKNQSLKHLKKAGTMKLVELGDAEEQHFTAGVSPEKELERKELHLELERAVDQLPAQAKMVFRLIKENDLKYKEVAELLDISPRTVQTQLFRAIAKLRVTLQTHAPGAVGSNLLILTTLTFILEYFLKL